MDWKKIIKYLTPKEIISGISISDNDVKIVLFDNNDKDKKVKIKLEAELEDGIIEDGLLKKPDELREVLVSLRNSPELSKFKQMNAVLSLASGSVYHKTFSLPAVSSQDFSTAVELNIKMISPIKFEESYFDWELLQADKENGLDYKISAVFAKKEVVDPFLRVLKESGFFPLVVEFSAMSVWRLFNDGGLIPDKNGDSCLIVLITSEGIDFSAMNKNGLQFNYFQEWKKAVRASIGEGISEGELSREQFFKVLNEEARKVFSFFVNRFSGKLSCFYLFSPAYGEALEQVVAKQFNLPVSKKPISFDFSPGFFAASGAAIRGAINRVDDVSISLMEVGTEEEYRRRRYLSFFSFWNKMVILIFSLMMAASFGIWLFFNVSENNFRNDLNNLNLRIDNEQFQELKNVAQESNKLISGAVSVSDRTRDWTGFFKFWQEQASEIGINKLSISSADSVIQFRGWTNTEQRMIDFKNNINKSEFFSEAEVPIQSIIKQANGVEFTLSFKIDSLP